MIQPVAEVFSNRILMAGAVAWVISQTLKILIFTIVHHEIVWERLIGDGGMPSSHSATVTSVAVSTGILQGWNSAIFAVAAIMAIVVMHDAMGVRRETGKQAIAINEIIEHILTDDDVDLTPEQTLKEFVGHSPLQVSAGFLIGVTVALVMNL